MLGTASNMAQGKMANEPLSIQPHYRCMAGPIRSTCRRCPTLAAFKLLYMPFTSGLPTTDKARFCWQLVSGARAANLQAMDATKLRRIPDSEKNTECKDCQFLIKSRFFQKLVRIRPGQISDLGYGKWACNIYSMGQAQAIRWFYFFIYPLSSINIVSRRKSYRIHITSRLKRSQCFISITPTLL